MHIADQPPCALLQRDHRRGNLPVGERVAAGLAQRLEPRDQHRIVRRGERQFVDDDDAQRFADDVHSFPEAGSSQQHTISRGAKIGQQPVPRSRALNEQRKIDALWKDFGSATQRAVRSE